MGQGGVACPKPEPRKRVKARRKLQAAKVVKSVRAAVVERAGGKCERCGLWPTWGHAHHRKPRSLGGKWTVENIILLCPSCHAKAHRRTA
jgi:5-methylcytosine-specific restriction endonuclease McrA